MAEEIENGSKERLDSVFKSIESALSAQTEVLTKITSGIDENPETNIENAAVNQNRPEEGLASIFKSIEEAMIKQTSILTTIASHINEQIEIDKQRSEDEREAAEDQRRTSLFSRLFRSPLSRTREESSVRGDGIVGDAGAGDGFNLSKLIPLALLAPLVPMFIGSFVDGFMEGLGDTTFTEAIGNLFKSEFGVEALLTAFLGKRGFIGSIIANTIGPAITGAIEGLGFDLNEEQQNIIEGVLSTIVTLLLFTGSRRLLTRLGLGAAGAVATALGIRAIGQGGRTPAASPSVRDTTETRPTSPRPRDIPEPRIPSVSPSVADTPEARPASRPRDIPEPRITTTPSPNLATETSRPSIGGRLTNAFTGLMESPLGRLARAGLSVAGSLPVTTTIFALGGANPAGDSVRTIEGNPFPYTIYTDTPADLEINYLHTIWKDVIEPNNGSPESINAAIATVSTLAEGPQFAGYSTQDLQNPALWESLVQEQRVNPNSRLYDAYIAGNREREAREARRLSLGQSIDPTAGNMVIPGVTTDQTGALSVEVPEWRRSTPQPTPQPSININERSDRALIDRINRMSTSAMAPGASAVVAPVTVSSGGTVNAPSSVTTNVTHVHTNTLDRPHYMLPY